MPQLFFLVLLILAVIGHIMVCGCMCGCMGYVSACLEGTTNISDLMRQPFRVQVRDQWIQEYDEVLARMSTDSCFVSPSAFEALSLLAEPRVADAVKVLGTDPFLPTQASWENADMDSPKGYFPSPWYIEFLHKHLKKHKHTNTITDHSYIHRPPVGQVITTLGKAAQWILAIAFFSEMVRRFCANMPLAQGFERMSIQFIQVIVLFKDFSVCDFKMGSLFLTLGSCPPAMLQMQCEASGVTR